MVAARPGRSPGRHGVHRRRQVGEGAVEIDGDAQTGDHRQRPTDWPAEAAGDDAASSNGSAKNRPTTSLKLVERFGGVDRDAQVGAAVEALRVPGAERAQLVDHPALAAARPGVGGFDRLSRRLVAEPGALVLVAVHQQVDVVEQEPRPVGGGDLAHRPAGDQVLGLRQDPRIAQHAAAHEHAAHARAELVHDLPRLDAVARAEHRNAHAFGHRADEVPVGRAGVGLPGGAAVHGDRRGPGVLRPAAPPRALSSRRRPSPCASSR